MSGGLVVAAPLAYVRTVDGVVELEEGQPVPEDAEQEHVDLLVSQGVVAVLVADEPKSTAGGSTAASRRAADRGEA